MKAKASDWYKKIWTLDIKNMSWVENTPNEVDYLIDLCRLNGTERVLDLADGAIGYLENDEENLRIFDVISRALKNGGQHVCDLVCGDYAEAHFPVKLWDAGEKSISLSEFDWYPDTRIMMFGNRDFAYGKVLTKPEIAEGDPMRVYTLAEIKEIMKVRGMRVTKAFAGYSKQPAGSQSFQMLVHSQKD